MSSENEIAKEKYIDELKWCLFCLLRQKRVENMTDNEATICYLLLKEKCVNDELDKRLKELDN